MADNVVVADNGVEWWYEAPRDAYVGTWQGITRSTEPMWRSVPVVPNSNISRDTVWILGNNGRVFFSPPPYDPYSDPAMQLQEGL